MGEPRRRGISSSRNEQAVISPSWSIHSGVGTPGVYVHLGRWAARTRSSPTWITSRHRTCADDAHARWSDMIAPFDLDRQDRDRHRLQHRPRPGRSPWRWRRPAPTSSASNRSDARTTRGADRGARPAAAVDRAADLATLEPARRSSRDAVGGARRHRHPRQQRRHHPPRRRARLHRARLGRGDRRQPEDGVLPVAGGGAACSSRRARRQDHQHRLDAVLPGRHPRAAYTAAKSGVAGLTRLLANEWAARGINVNAIAPGYMETNNTAALRADPERNRGDPRAHSRRPLGHARRISPAPPCSSPRPRPTTSTGIRWPSTAAGWRDNGRGGATYRLIRQQVARGYVHNAS